MAITELIHSTESTTYRGMKWKEKQSAIVRQVGEINLFAYRWFEVISREKHS